MAGKRLRRLSAGIAVVAGNVAVVPPVFAACSISPAATTATFNGANCTAITNDGTLAGGMTVQNSTIGTLTNNGTAGALSGIHAPSAGLNLNNLTGNVVNNGVISGTNNGIFANGVSGAIVNNGTIRSNSEAALYLNSTVSGGIRNAGAIIGGSRGIDAWAPTTITNSGRIQGNTSAISFEPGSANSRLINTGVVAGNISMSGASTIDNYGTVTGTTTLDTGGILNFYGGSLGPIRTNTAGGGTVNVAPGAGSSVSLSSVGGITAPLAAVNVNSGTLVLTNNGSIYATNPNVNSGGTLALGGAAGAIGGGSLNLNGGTLNLGTGRLTVAGLNSSAGSVIYSTITGGSTYGNLFGTGGNINLTNATFVPLFAPGVSPVAGNTYTFANAGTGVVNVSTAPFTTSQGVTWQFQSTGVAAPALGVSGVASGAAATPYTNGGQVIGPAVGRLMLSNLFGGPDGIIDGFLTSGGLAAKKEQQHAMGGHTGLAAGEAPAAISGSGWANFNGQHMVITHSGADSAGQLVTAATGGDVSPSDNTMFGVALTGEGADMVTRFNQGNLDEQGFSLMPYAAWRIADHIGLGVILGHSWLNYQEMRTAGTFGLGAVTGHYQGQRWMASGKAEYFDTLGPWSVNGFASYRWALENDGSFVETDNSLVERRATHLGEMALGGKASRSFGRLEPYAGLQVMHDIALSQGQNRWGSGVSPTGRDGMEAIAGVNVRVSSVVFSVEASDTAYTKGTNSFGGMLNVHSDF